MDVDGLRVAILVMEDAKKSLVEATDIANTHGQSRRWSNSAHCLDAVIIGMQIAIGNAEREAE